MYVSRFSRFLAIFFVLLVHLPGSVRRAVRAAERGGGVGLDLGSSQPVWGLGGWLWIDECGNIR